MYVYVCVYTYIYTYTYVLYAQDDNMCVYGFTTNPSRIVPHYIYIYIYIHMFSMRKMIICVCADSPRTLAASYLTRHSVIVCYRLYIIHRFVII